MMSNSFQLPAHFLLRSRLEQLIIIGAVVAPSWSLAVESIRAAQLGLFMVAGLYGGPALILAWLGRLVGNFVANIIAVARFKLRDRGAGSTGR